MSTKPGYTTTFRRRTVKEGATRGFTLLEILIVVGIIGMLVSLLLPAVQSTREAARKYSCGNNLSQLIMALHQYESFHEVLPPGTVNATAPILSQPKGYHHSWITQILPFIEQNNAYQHIDRRLSVYDVGNSKVRIQSLSVLACPSENVTISGTNHYAGVHHDLESPIDTTNNGVLFLNSAIGIDDISDGRSHTMFLGERLAEANELGWMSGTRSTMRNTGLPLNAFSRVARGASRLLGLQLPEPGSDSESGEMVEYGQLRTGPMGWMKEDAPEEDPIWQMIDEQLGALEPAGAQPANSGAIPPVRRAVTLTGVGGFGSAHVKGAQFAMGDGAVRFVSQSISLTVYRRMAHRCDGHLVNRSDP